MLKKLLIWFLSILLLVLISAGLGWYLYTDSALDIKEEKEFIINKDETYEQVKRRLVAEHQLKHPFLFDKLSEKMNYKNLVTRGKYILKPNMNTRELIVVLRQGATLTTNLVIRPLIDKETLWTTLDNKLQASKNDFIDYFENVSQIDSNYVNDTNLLCFIIPDTYNVFWHSYPEDVFKKLESNYLKFWNKERKQKAKALGLTPVQVAILASIVDKETNKTEEMPRIAGLYLNRLQKNWKLQADPTVKFALGQPDLKRVLYVHTQVESPYNTYYVYGLPPAPLCIPSQQAIQAVLTPEKHEYMFMCAKEDFSGYHNFAVTDREHLINSKRYQKALNLLEKR